jgi:hypothetical protein
MIKQDRAFHIKRLARLKRSKLALEKWFRNNWETQKHRQIEISERSFALWQEIETLSCDLYPSYGFISDDRDITSQGRC